VATDARNSRRERTDAQPCLQGHGLVGEAIDGEDSGQAPHCTDTIEEALYEHRKSLFGAISVAFFDTTSLYFEGDGGATLGQRGHSKDFRPQLPQVVLGIVLDEQDRPIASFLWPGNTADVTTLRPVVDQRFVGAPAIGWRHANVPDREASQAGETRGSGCAPASGSSGPALSPIAA
jgi:hypothetical protein